MIATSKDDMMSSLLGKRCAAQSRRDGDSEGGAGRNPQYRLCLARSSSGASQCLTIGVSHRKIERARTVLDHADQPTRAAPAGP